MDAFKVAVLGGFVFVGVVAAVHFSGTPWAVPPQAPKATEIPSAPAVDDGPKIDRAKIYAWVCERAPATSGGFDLARRTQHQMVLARVDTGQGGVLTEADLEFLARLFTEVEVKYVKEHGRTSDESPRKPVPHEMAKDEIRSYFDSAMVTLRAENDENIKRNAEARKTQKAIDDALGGKGR